MIEFDESRYFTGPDLTDEMFEAAERSLRVRLPASYVSLLRKRNGGMPIRHCYPTSFRTSWAHDHIDIGAIKGIGGEWGIDSRDFGSAYLVKEWGYPDIGVVICETPSGGHDTVMLDYTAGPEPAVVYVDEADEPVARRIAETFDEFLANLVDCDLFEP